VHDVFREATGFLGHDAGFQSLTPKRRRRGVIRGATFVRTGEKAGSLSYSAALISARTSSISSFALVPSRRAISS
jgi:hypothetical protein